MRISFQLIVAAIICPLITKLTKRKFNKVFMDILLYILSAICLLAGFIGCFVPVIPGPPLSYIGLLLLHFTEKEPFSATYLLIILAIVVVIQILDYIVPSLGSKLLGGSRWGSRGCLAGTIIGMFFLPLGIIAGPFLGAVVGELIGGKDFGQAIVSGLGSFIGFLASTLLKLAISVYMIYMSITVLFM